ncbi:hypothetical protein LWM68_01740 [Niabella sp. W65]|nr:hypothetical protein [Niabella sp. W65]MCH7361618.1 hypothetical protein [Niabella sp. W65]ULT45406.1 hypothetical protein KRR40_20290 [Niabella sp. I65]
MRKRYGGKWISFLSIPPLIFLFMALMIREAYIHKKVVRKRRQRLRNNPTVNEAFIGSWF